jgi:hypothetical protein
MERVIEKEGYIVINPLQKRYFDEYIDEVEDFNNAYIFKTIEEAIDAIEDNTDCLDEYDVHKVKIAFTTEQIFKRKVTYEPSENLIEKDE